MKDFFSKCDEIGSFLRIWYHLLKKSLIENFTFCAVHLPQKLATLVLLLPWQSLNTAFYFTIDRIIISSTNVAFSPEHVHISKRYSIWDPSFYFFFRLGCANYVWIFQKFREHYSNIKPILVLKSVNTGIAISRAASKRCTFTIDRMIISSPNVTFSPKYFLKYLKLGLKLNVF